jgi:hypothetical protein
VPTPAASPEAPPAVAEVVAEIRLATDPMSSPAGMVFGPDGTLYVIDAVKDQIRLFDRDGRPVATWRSDQTAISMSSIPSTAGESLPRPPSTGSRSFILVKSPIDFLPILN